MEAEGEVEEEVGNMVSRERNIWHLILGVSGLSALGWFINSFSPTKPLYLTVFFLTVLLSFLFLSLYLLQNVRRSLLLSTGLAIFLLLRLLDLRHPLYVILLFACLLSLELSLRKR